jgi:hypothetical protein
VAEKTRIDLKDGRIEHYTRDDEENQSRQVPRSSDERPGKIGVGQRLASRVETYEPVGGDDERDRDNDDGGHALRFRRDSLGEKEYASHAQKQGIRETSERPCQGEEVTVVGRSLHQAFRREGVERIHRADEAHGDGDQQNEVIGLSLKIKEAQYCSECSHAHGRPFHQTVYRSAFGVRRLGDRAHFSYGQRLYTRCTFKKTESESVKGNRQYTDCQDRPDQTSRQTTFNRFFDARARVKMHQGGFQMRLATTINCQRFMVRLLDHLKDAL